MVYIFNNMYFCFCTGNCLPFNQQYGGLNDHHLLHELNSDWCIREPWPHSSHPWTELWLVHTGTLATLVSYMNWTLIGANGNLGHTHLICELNSDWCMREPWPHSSHPWTELWLVHEGTLATPISSVNWTLIGAWGKLIHVNWALVGQYRSLA